MRQSVRDVHRNCDDSRASRPPKKRCHPERSEGPMHLFAATRKSAASQKIPRKFRHSRPVLGPRAPLCTWELCGEGNDPCHALSAIERRPGVLLKLRYPRRFLMLSGRKLALTLAFTVLVALAFGASCQGFFTKPNGRWPSPPRRPPFRQATGNTQQFSAVGIFDTGQRQRRPSPGAAARASTVASLGIATAWPRARQPSLRPPPNSNDSGHLPRSRSFRQCDFHHRDAVEPKSYNRRTFTVGEGPERE